VRGPRIFSLHDACEFHSRTETSARGRGAVGSVELQEIGAVDPAATTRTRTAPGGTAGRVTCSSCQCWPRPPMSARMVGGAV